MKPSLGPRHFVRNILVPDRSSVFAKLGEDGNTGGSCLRTTCLEMGPKCTAVRNSGLLDSSVWCASMSTKLAAPRTAPTSLAPGFYRWKLKYPSYPGNRFSAFYNKGKFVHSPVFELREAKSDSAACTQARSCGSRLGCAGCSCAEIRTTRTEIQKMQRP